MQPLQLKTSAVLTTTSVYSNSFLYAFLLLAGMNRSKAEDKVWTQPSQVSNVESLPRGANAKEFDSYPFSSHWDHLSPVFRPCLLVQHRRLSQYLKGLNCSFKHVKWRALEGLHPSSPDSMLWRSYLQTNSTNLPALWSESPWKWTLQPQVTLTGPQPSWHLTATPSETWARTIQESCSESMTQRISERQ